MLIPTLPLLNPTDKLRIQAHLDNLAKPQDSLGQLESLALQMAWISNDSLLLTSPKAFLLTFAGDHGITKQKISTTPAAMTAKIVKNIANGNAIISSLCRANNIQHRVIDVGVATPCNFLGVKQRNIMRGTEDPTTEPAMTKRQAEASLQAGVDEVYQIPDFPFVLLGVSEIGIANSTIATLLISVCLGIDPTQIIELNSRMEEQKQLKHKLLIVQKILRQYTLNINNPIEILATIGGCEFCAMVGAMLAGASRRWAVIIDSYAAIAAAILAIRLEPRLSDFLIWSHIPIEPGAKKVMEYLKIAPLLDLHIRLGGGIGVALAIPILRSAWAIIHDTTMANSTADNKLIIANVN